MAATDPRLKPCIRLPRRSCPTAGCKPAPSALFNLSDFPASILDPFDIKAIHADPFILRLWDEYPADVLEAMRLQRAGLKKPPRTAAEYIATLEQCQLPETATRLRPHAAKVRGRDRTVANQRQPTRSHFCDAKSAKVARPKIIVSAPQPCGPWSYVCGARIIGPRSR